MNLKKNLKTKGQASLEYFLLFGLIISLTLLSLTSFLPKVRTSGENLFKTAAGRILNADEAP